MTLYNVPLRLTVTVTRLVSVEAASEIEARGLAAIAAVKESALWEVAASVPDRIGDVERVHLIAPVAFTPDQGGSPGVGDPTPADPLGWIDWAGGECPVPFGTPVEVRHRSGGVFRALAGAELGAAAVWWHSGEDGDQSDDIVAYRRDEG